MKLQKQPAKIIFNFHAVLGRQHVSNSIWMHKSSASVLLLFNFACHLIFFLLSFIISIFFSKSFLTTKSAQESRKHKRKPFVGDDFFLHLSAFSMFVKPLINCTTSLSCLSLHSYLFTSINKSPSTLMHEYLKQRRVSGKLFWWRVWGGGWTGFGRNRIKPVSLILSNFLPQFCSLVQHSVTLSPFPSLAIL